jgi:hypothetical protein
MGEKRMWRAIAYPRIALHDRLMAIIGLTGSAVDAQTHTAHYVNVRTEITTTGAAGSANAS